MSFNSISIIRKVLNISIPKDNNSSTTTQKDDNQDDNTDNEDQSDDQDNGVDDEYQPEGDDEKQTENNGKSSELETEPEARPNHNGRRGSKDMSDVILLDHYPLDFKKGDSCPEEDCTGRLYPFKSNGTVREIITFDFTPPFRPTAHRMHDLRCNMCLKVFKATLPKDLLKAGASLNKHHNYLYRSLSALALLHYGMGMPFYRLDQFQSLVGERFPESTQFDQLENIANILQPINNALIKEVANGYIIQGDDVTNRIRNLDAELRERRSDGCVVYREGVHTSVLISTTSDGHLIPILKSGIIHFGELLDEVLLQRSKDLPSAIIVCDGSKVNQSFVAECSIGGCWEHNMMYFTKGLKGNPQEARVIVDLIKKIFKIDRETHGLDAIHRLNHLQEHGLPIVEQIKDLVNSYIINKIALPASAFGSALTYFTNQYSKLKLPFEAAGVPIHNNISEWCTYLIVRLLANSRSYQTQEGAWIGDKLITLILCSYLSSTNPYDYFLYCLENQEKMKSNPIAFFPWRLKGMVKEVSKHKEMKFWRPPPPDNYELLI